MRGGWFISPAPLCSPSKFHISPKNARAVSYGNESGARSTRVVRRRRPARQSCVTRRRLLSDAAAAPLAPRAAFHTGWITRLPPRLTSRHSISPELSDAATLVKAFVPMALRASQVACAVLKYLRTSNCDFLGSSMDVIGPTTRRSSIGKRASLGRLNVFSLQKKLLTGPAVGFVRKSMATLSVECT